jgi:hypothetical protein
LLKGIWGSNQTLLKWSLELSNGTAAGKFYGIQMVDSANKESSEVL